MLNVETHYLIFVYDKDKNDRLLMGIGQAENDHPSKKAMA